MKDVRAFVTLFCKYMLVCAFFGVFCVVGYTAVGYVEPQGGAYLVYTAFYIFILAPWIALTSVLLSLLVLAFAALGRESFRENLITYPTTRLAVGASIIGLLAGLIAILVFGFPRPPLF